MISSIEKIITKAHEVGAEVLIDGAQASPHIKADVQALDVILLASLFGGP